MTIEKTLPDKQTLLRTLPSVDRLLQLALEKGVVGVYGRSLTINALRHTIETHRTIILSGQYADPISDAQLLNSA
ncbi:MAG: hypothetical protein GY943_39685, partial [Chloroflexi bacterium]|nr:hypothetical protein [Chloroflexota bacterium]